MRLDLYLVANKLANTRSRAWNLIRLGAVCVNGIAADKPSREIKPQDTVEVIDAIKYSSLGGLKLERAIKRFNIQVYGTAIDIGASNGGFTDCLLRHGAQRVYAVDVGECALPAPLRNDSRVTIMDNVNARELLPKDFPNKVDLITIDVSFISLALILPPAALLLKDKGALVALIKPQFEVGRKHLTKSGIVKSAKARAEAVSKVNTIAIESGLTPLGLSEAPILFAEKNIEYLAYFVKDVK